MRTFGIKLTPKTSFSGSAYKGSTTNDKAKPAERWERKATDSRFLPEAMDDSSKGTRTTNMTVPHIAIAILVLGTTVAIFMVVQKRRAATAERRMIGMMECLGLDPAIGSNGEPDSIFDCVIEVSMKRIRKRCRACSNVEVCERWLADKENGDNVFCPNAKEFNALKTVCDDVANNHHTALT